jgi:RNA 3'-terminal phosphate cyclase (ATP)
MTPKTIPTKIEIDGSLGEGGGQVIRSSLSLSMITGIPVSIVNVRAGRKKPGLLRQHLTAVGAAAEISQARVAGDQLGSSKLLFEPGEIRPGNYQFQIGSAGSAILVAQTILPALLLASAPSTITIEGGTHNSMAPPYDYLANIYLPLVERMGPSFETEIELHGFYPAGGGKFCMRIEPASQLRGLKLLDRGARIEPHVTAIVSDLPISVAQRECSTIRRKANWPEDCCTSISVKRPRGPGNVVMIQLNCEQINEMFTGFGVIGVRAEQIARKVLREARDYIATNVPVGPHLADQLMLPMSLAAAHGSPSEFRTMPLTQHSLTQKTIIEQFLPVDIKLTEDETNIHVKIAARN